MKARALNSCVLLSILILILLSTAAQANEYREVNTKINADNVSKHIEKGDDIYLDNCSIFGEMNISKIKLKTVPNPYLNKLANGRHTPERSTFFILYENSSVIESKITIKNSIFENYTNFSNVLFNDSADFTEVNFNSSANFYGANFKNSADFSRANFNGSANFCGVDFNNSANFYGANFKNSADFSGVNFYDSAYLYYTDFNDSANFIEVNFYDSAYFCYTDFNDSVNFYGANFYDFADFSGTNFCGPVDFDWASFDNSADFTEVNFYDSAIFIGPDKSENIITSGKACETFRKYYNNEARYVDADTIYYNYRINYQEEKDWSDISKWTDYISWHTCGYGVRLSHTLVTCVIFVGFFSVLYKKGRPCMSIVNNKNKKIPLRFYWQGSGIYRSSDIAEKKSIVSGWNALYFSIITFTTVGSGEWYPKDNYRKWVTFEGLLGWIMLGIFMATLTRVMIRG